ncbi:MAG: hypothetical protein GY787_16975 [Alteromonadales bacterium]|nr:hypothetical protein [Alteromonadales bacterium]
MKKVLVLTISSLFLVACGGNGGSDSSQKSNIDEPSLSDISGIWDESETIDEKVDVIYSVIKDHGELILYDYDGDSYHNGDDCYYKYSFTITDLGGGAFEVYTPEANVNISIVLSDNKLIATHSDGSSFTTEKSSIQESELSPLCSELTRSSTLGNSISENKNRSYYRK